MDDDSSKLFDDRLSGTTKSQLYFKSDVSGILKDRHVIKTRGQEGMTGISFASWC